jgi:hypothetical protein
MKMLELVLEGEKHVKEAKNLQILFFKIQLIIKILRYRFHFAIQNSYEVLKDPQNFNTLPAFRFHVNIHPL